MTQPRWLALTRALRNPPPWLKGAGIGAALLGGVHLVTVLFPARPLDRAIPPPHLERLLMTTPYVVLEGGVVGGVFAWQRTRTAARGLAADVLAGVVAMLAWGVITILFGVRQARFGYGILFLVATAIAGVGLGFVLWALRRRP